MSPDIRDDHHLALPPDLAELDAELSDFLIEERPSFAPELRAELSREWLRGRSWPLHGGLYRATAAAVGGLFFVGMVFSPARASLLRLLGVLQTEDEVLEVAEEVGPPRSFAEPARSLEPEEPIRTTSSARVTLPPADAEALPPFEPGGSTFPELVDREADQKLIRRYYPPRLLERGVGGRVLVQLWVDSTGAVDLIKVREGSGVPELDKAALRAASDLRFVPALRLGVPVGTWVEFPLVFRPLTLEDGLPSVGPLEAPGAPAALDPDLPPAWKGDVVITAPIEVEGQEMLRAALGGSRGEIESRLGPLDGLLQGEPPPGVSPLTWRRDAADALEAARVRDPANPAPYLALGRIRRNQGLAGNARVLFEEGIRRGTSRSRPVSATLMAELHYQRGLILKESSLAWRNLGEVPAEALEGAGCAHGGGAGNPDGTVPAETLIAWSYLCPAPFDEVMGVGFRPTLAGSDDHGEMLRSFERATAAHPAHPGANVETLLALADEGRWYEVLSGARRFTWASGGHVHALLLSGIALQRLGRSEEALADLRAALRGLPDEESRRLTDVGLLLDPESARVFAGLSGQRREDAIRGFWRPLDPILATVVNEREVEHLARTAHAWLRFGGVETDPGQVWVRYGAPLAIRALGEGKGLRTEFWDYGGGPDVTFRRPSVSARMDLTSEAQAYLEELRTVFPHRYGSQSRQVFTLPAQIARFRTGGGFEVQVHARVPQALATGAKDSLELGVFLLGSAGERAEVSRRHVPATVSRLDVTAPAGENGQRVVVELYHPGTMQAAAVRAPAFRGGAAGEDRRISDLLLVSATTGSRGVSRLDRGVKPFFGNETVATDSIGVLFELYDLPPGEEPYHVRVELQPAGSQERRAVPTRPAGQASFAQRWSQRPRQRTPFTEYLTLDLRGTGEGAHTLHVVVELPGGSEIRESVPLTVRGRLAGRGQGLESGH